MRSIRNIKKCAAFPKVLMQLFQKLQRETDYCTQSLATLKIGTGLEHASTINHRWIFVRNFNEIQAKIDLRGVWGAIAPVKHIPLIGPSRLYALIGTAVRL